MHPRSQKSILNDNEALLGGMLVVSKKKTIHQRCINSLLIEDYKYGNGYSPNSINSAFTSKLLEFPKFSYFSAKYYS